MSRDQKPARFKEAPSAALRDVATALPAVEQLITGGAVPVEIAKPERLRLILIAIFLVSCLIGGLGTALLPQIMS